MNKVIIPCKNNKIVEEEYHLKREIPRGLSVEVKKGQKVKKDTILASGEMACEKERVDISSQLGIKPGESKKYVTCLNGERISKGDEIALKKKSMIRKEKKIVASTSGVVNLDEISAGILTIMDTTKEATVNSGVNGVVISVIKNKQVDILSEVLRIFPFSIFGSSVQGELFYIQEKQDEVEVGKNLRDSIIAFDFSPSSQLLRKLAMAGVVGIIVGGVSSDVLANVESSGLWGMTLCILEGVGEIALDKELIKIIKRNDGYLSILEKRENVLILTNAKEILPSESQIKLVKRVEINDRVQILDGCRRGQYGRVKEVGSEYVKVKTDKGKLVDIDLLNLVIAL